MAASSEPQPEFSRLVPIDRLGEAEIPEEIPEEIPAEPGERAALARRWPRRDLDIFFLGTAMTFDFRIRWKALLKSAS